MSTSPTTSPTTSPNCLFCKIVSGQIKAAITYRDDKVLAFKDIGPKAPLHELVIPLDHHETLADADDAHAPLYGHLMVVAAKRAKESGQATGGFRVVMNAGPDAGQSVFHVHLHVLAGRPLAWPPG
jgi:histidine triad (HIT) family protein